MRILTAPSFVRPVARLGARPFETEEAGRRHARSMCDAELDVDQGALSVAVRFEAVDHERSGCDGVGPGQLVIFESLEILRLDRSQGRKLAFGRLK